MNCLPLRKKSRNGTQVQASLKKLRYVINSLFDNRSKYVSGQTKIVETRESLFLEVRFWGDGQSETRWCGSKTNTIALYSLSFTTLLQNLGCSTNRCQKSSWRCASIVCPRQSFSALVRGPWTSMGKRSRRRDTQKMVLARPPPETCFAEDAFEKTRRLTQNSSVSLSYLSSAKHHPRWRTNSYFLSFFFRFSLFWTFHQSVTMFVVGGANVWECCSVFANRRGKIVLKNKKNVKESQNSAKILGLDNSAG